MDASITDKLVKAMAQERQAEARQAQTQLRS
jgi:hypothetical protein